MKSRLTQPSPFQLYSNESRLSASFKQPCVRSCRWVTLWVLLGICFTCRNLCRLTWFVLFTLHSATAVLRHLWLSFTTSFHWKATNAQKLLEHFLKMSPFRRWTSSDSVRGIFLLHLQDEFTQEGCASCHGIKANKRPILQQECATPPPSPLWISNVSPHAEFVTPHETSRVVSCVLRRRADSGFCCFNRSKDIDTVRSRLLSSFSPRELWTSASIWFIWRDCGHTMTVFDYTR